MTPLKIQRKEHHENRTCSRRRRYEMCIQRRYSGQIFRRQYHIFLLHRACLPGAANTLSYLAGQRGRNLRFYTEHLNDPRYLSVRSLVRTGNLFGLQYIYGTLTNSDGADPLDYSAVMENPAEFYMPATDGSNRACSLFFPNMTLSATITTRLWQPALFPVSAVL